MIVDNVNKLDKSELAYYPFSKKEVLNSENEIALRKHDLQRAMLLGNLHKHSVTIYFENTAGEEKVVTGSVWSMTSKFVQLKGDITIPINSISQVIV